MARPNFAMRFSTILGPSEKNDVEIPDVVQPVIKWWRCVDDSFNGEVVFLVTLD